jgi:hypothetical protein
VSENDRLDEKAVELEAVLNSLDERARLLVKN